MTILLLIWTVLYHLKNIIASAAGNNFSGWVQFGIGVYIPHCKYQVKSPSWPLLSFVSAAAIAHRIRFFCQYKQIKFFACNVKFIQASNHCKSVLETAKFVYAWRTKVSILSQDISSPVLLSFTKVNELYCPYLTTLRCCLLHLIKQNCKWLYSEPWSWYLLSLLELIWICIIFL